MEFARAGEECSLRIAPVMRRTRRCRSPAHGQRSYTQYDNSAPLPSGALIAGFLKQAATALRSNAAEHAALNFEFP